MDEAAVASGSGASSGAGGPDDRSARLTLRGIEVFVAVVEAGALAAAAARLGASPSSVSQQVTNLETALGTRLVDRTARPFALTPAGGLFLARARAMLDEAAEARSELAALGHAGLPALTLAAIEDFDADVTPAFVQALAEALPGCHIACRSGPSHDNLRALAEHRVDLAIAAVGDDAPADAACHPLLHEPFVLVTARGLLGDGADARQVLGERPFVGYGAGLPMQRRIVAQFRRLRFDVRPRFAFDTNHAALATVARVGGWTVSTPAGYLRAPRLHARLEIRPLPFQGFAREIALFARPSAAAADPARCARLLRGLMAGEILPTARQSAPWLGASLRVLGEAEP